MSKDQQSRVPLITDREEVTCEYKEHFDRIANTRGSVRGPFSALMNRPVIAGRTARLGAYLRYNGSLPDDIRELAILTTAREYDCEYEWVVHRPIAQEAGVDEETIDVIAARGPTDHLPNHHANIIVYGRELMQNNDVSDAIFDSARDQTGIEGIIELTALIGYYGMLAHILNAFEVFPGIDPNYEPQLG